MDCICIVRPHSNQNRFMYDEDDFDLINIEYSREKKEVREKRNYEAVNSLFVLSTLNHNTVLFFLEVKLSRP